MISNVFTHSVHQPDTNKRHNLHKNSHPAQIFDYTTLAFTALSN